MTDASVLRGSLLTLHGFTMNGEAMRRQMGNVGRRLERRVSVTHLDAPLPCEEPSVARLYERMEDRRIRGPHLCWWDASEDGSRYRGWRESLDFLKQRWPKQGPVGLLGFSQGAMVAATVAAMAQRGEMETPAYVILVAGAVPRATDLVPYFARPISVPSLHVVGLQDSLMAAAPYRSLERFDEGSRELVEWPGTHTVPRSGEAADRIVEFVSRFS